MTDAELRALVRDAVARHLGAGRAASVRRARGAACRRRQRGRCARVGDASGEWPSHPSHYRYLTLTAPDSACVIEPSVACDHCGYCKSHGH